MSDIQIHIRSGLKLAIIVTGLPFLFVFVFVLAPGGHDWQCRPALQTFSLATCLTDAINTVHSYDPYILYQQSSRGHTSKLSNNYLRQESLFAACCEYPIMPSVWRGGVKEQVWHTRTFSHKQECISGSFSYNRWAIHIIQNVRQTHTNAYTV